MPNDINKTGSLKKSLKNTFMVVPPNVYGLIIGWLEDGRYDPDQAIFLML